MYSARMPSHERGFTLIELSIVLVIIGLIAGGVLVGQDLIKAATLRGQISQIEKYNTSVNTFRLKYNALPGDFYASYAAQFGMATRAGTYGRGNGDGAVTTVTSYLNICAETSLFFNDLTVAGLIDGNFVGVDADDSVPNCPAGVSTPEIVHTYVPKARITNNASVTVVYDASYGVHLWFVSTFARFSTSGGRSTQSLTFTPADAYQIDAKVDDGYPITGRTTARDTAAVLVVPAAPASSVCASNATTPNPYNLSASTGGNTAACNMTFVFQ